MLKSPVLRKKIFFKRALYNSKGELLLGPGNYDIHADSENGWLCIIEKFPSDGSNVLISYFAARYQAALLREYNMTLRSQILKKVIHMDYLDFSQKQPVEYASWLINDINQIERNSILPFFTIVQAVSSGIFSVIALASMHYSILLLSVISGIALTVIPNIFTNIMEKSAYEQSAKGEELFQKVFNILSGFQVFLTYGRKHIIQSKLAKPCLALELEKEKFNKKKALMDMLNLAVFRLFEMSVMVFTAILAFMGIVDMGAVFSIGNIGNRFLNAASDTLSNWTLVKSSGKIFDKFTISDNPSPLHPAKEYLPVTLKDGISVENLTVKYRRKIVFQNQNFLFSANKKYAVMGESGSGKSTLIKCIMGMHRDYTGKICLNQKDLKEYPFETLYQLFAYISQNPYVFSDTIRFNLTLDADYTDQELMEVLEKVNLGDFMKSQSKGLDTLLDNNGDNISGGQKQRLCIVRAVGCLVQSDKLTE